MWRPGARQRALGRLRRRSRRSLPANSTTSAARNAASVKRNMRDFTSREFVCAAARRPISTATATKRNISRNITSARGCSFSLTGRTAPKSLREGPLMVKCFRNASSSVKNAIVLDLAGPQDRRRISLPFRDSGQNGPPPLLTRSGGARSPGVRGEARLLAVGPAPRRHGRAGQA